LFDFNNPKPGKDYELKKMYGWLDPTESEAQLEKVLDRHRRVIRIREKEK